jgi:hypothetical protein
MTSTGRTAPTSGIRMNPLRRTAFLGGALDLLTFALPERQELYAYRTEQGYAPSAPVSEVVPPGR